jgi:hypothetical protein
VAIDSWCSNAEDNAVDMKKTHKMHFSWRELRSVLILSPVILLAASIGINFFAMFLEPYGSEFVEQEPGNSVDVYIPGAGFSGFFYTLGRLQALHNAPPEELAAYEYYCFSAGCLALITSLLKIPIDSAIELAHSSRDKWMMGEIGRYNVVEHFVDGLMFHAGPEEQLLNLTIDRYSANATRDTVMNIIHQSSSSSSSSSSLDRHENSLNDLLPRINIITSTWTKQSLFSQSIQKPTSVDHLRRLLVQTTWIPFITGSSIYDNDYHNDGVFAGLLQSLNPLSVDEPLFQPWRHHHSLLLPWSFELLSHGLNILLDREKAIKFWKDGFKRGEGGMRDPITTIV